MSLNFQKMSLKTKKTLKMSLKPSGLRPDDPAVLSEALVKSKLLFEIHILMTKIYP